MDYIFDGLDDMGFADLAGKKAPARTGVKRSTDRAVMNARIEAKKKRRSQSRSC